MRVAPVGPEDLAAPLHLLEDGLRDGVPASEEFLGSLRAAVGRGDVEVLAAWEEDGPVGVAVLAFRPSISAGGPFASVEELYVREESRGAGTGRMLLEAVAGRCVARGVSYVEVQTDDEAAPFYTALGFASEPEVRVLSRSLPSGPP